MTEDEKPKLHIDSDWKAEARKEKERLAEQAQDAADAAGGDAGPQAGQAGQLPQPDMKALVGILAYQAAACLGSMSDPSSGKVMVDPPGAKFHIDLLAVLEEKTAGNLTDEEANELSQVLMDLRGGFVQIMQQLSSQTGGSGGAGPAPGGPGPIQP